MILAFLSSGSMSSTFSLISGVCVLPVSLFRASSTSSRGIQAMSNSDIFVMHHWRSVFMYSVTHQLTDVYSMITPSGSKVCSLITEIGSSTTQNHEVLSITSQLHLSCFWQYYVLYDPVINTNDLMDIDNILLKKIYYVWW